ncbi:hypothetical protein ID866_4283 [Astraeus odoratus]|nr:hypothetical protein ID866_4283 [Astraeus odoratus]
MDDALEIPQAHLKPSPEGAGDDEHSSGDEDGGLDWTKLPKSGTARPVIPKRGEKDFEPTHGGGSALQLHVLDRARGAMFEALRAERSISSKSVSYGIWHPSIARVHVTTTRGVLFVNMGHSVARLSGDVELIQPRVTKPPKRLELLPEEAIYLIERGALFCYKCIQECSLRSDNTGAEEASPGAPMTVQQAYAEMIGCEDMTLERYQVYAYLKRLGFVLTRAKPPTPDYPVSPPLPPHYVANSVPTVFQTIMALFKRVVLNVLGDVFRALRFLPCGHTTPLHKSSLPSSKTTQTQALSFLPVPRSENSPYTVFFHVYKPSTPFRKTAPPPPDFYVVVINAREAPMPSLYELSNLFETLPFMPPPPPRKRGIQANGKKSQNVAMPGTLAPPDPVLVPITTPVSTPPTFLQRLMSFVCFSSSVTSTPTPPSKSQHPLPPKPNPFVHLKAGKKSVVVAAVDSGNISFFRFGEGSFHDWPMV